MVKISKSTLKKAIQKSERFTLEEKMKALEQIALKQPHIFASVLVQNQMGNSFEQMEVLLNILLVSFLALKEAGINIVQISEKDQEAGLQKLLNNVKESRLSKSGAIQEYINSNSERLLLAYACDEMRKAGFFDLQHENSKFLIMAGINIVNCIASANLA